ncbi:MAG TPA: hypothetical protein EYP14_06335, partial [Planctomycetaceae bacterium]|nr:hypothetical protein [Planctomycetaceae bacterium]
GHGDDSILSTDASDTVYAGDGADTVVGGLGDDSIVTGDGNDSVTGDGGNDTVVAGDGQDTVDVGAGNDSVDGGDGNDSITGGEGDDTLGGGSSWRSGNDTIDGAEGNDQVFAGTGDDWIDGGEGDDSLRGQGGNDTLIGGIGLDQLEAGAGNDLITADPVYVSIDDVTIDPEGDSGTTDALLTVTLSEAVSFDVSVDYATADGTATAGTDYTLTAGTVSFPAGQTTATISVPVIGETDIEPDEYFFVNLSNPSAGLAVLDGQGQITIIDDDNPAPSLTGLNFTGSTLSEAGFTPPDTMGAVGPNHIVELLNGRYAVYDKATELYCSRAVLTSFGPTRG